MSKGLDEDWTNGGRPGVTNRDSHTTNDQMKEWVRGFCEERAWDPYHGPKDLAIGLVTEASELLENFRFVNDAKAAEMMRDAKARERVADELADSLYFILRFAQMYGFDLAECLSAKLKKNAVKYPAPPHQ